MTKKHIVIRQKISEKKIKSMKRKFDISLGESKMSSIGASGSMKNTEGVGFLEFEDLADIIPRAMKGLDIELGISTNKENSDLTEDEQLEDSISETDLLINKNTDTELDNESVISQDKHEINGNFHEPKGFFVKKNGKESHKFEWDLSFTTQNSPVFLFEELFYTNSKNFPNVCVTPSPLAEFGGVVLYNETEISIDGWIGSQTHSWGKFFAHEQAWGQVTGFGKHRKSHLEVTFTTVSVACRMQKILLLVLHHNGIIYRANSLYRGNQAHSKSSFIRKKYVWEFQTETHKSKIHGKFFANNNLFVALGCSDSLENSANCLVTELASCKLSILNKKTGTKTHLKSNRNCSLEIITEDFIDGINIFVL
eukprot:Anaeramoba_ignava/c19622_g1_i2.p1 GENE.c19622_g1_i2~~c19622_g1_i2.p1  ORF type:complete len:367 (+),score=73.34 c19622_g1_i2:252-1352(+)